MLTHKERFELFITYMRDRTLLTPEQVQGIEERLENCPAFISHYKKEEADGIVNSKIFKNGQIKASVKPSDRLLTVENLECFLTQVLIAIHDITSIWLTNLRGEIKDDLNDHFAELIIGWGLLRRRLINLALIRKDRNIIGKELRKLQKDVLSKIFKHKFPDESIEFLKDAKKDNVIDHLTFIFKTNIPRLKDAPMSHRISELLYEFGIDVKPETIRQRITRAKAQSK